MSSSWSDTDWRGRLTERLEPLLKSPQLVAEISTYQGVPFALFVYPPTAEPELRREMAMLATRVEQAAGRKVHVVSMADVLWEAIRAAYPPDGKRLFDSERNLHSEPQEDRLVQLRDNMEQLLSDVAPIPDAIRKRAEKLNPDRDLLFISRVGTLFPAYRTSALLDNLMGIVTVPTIIFYPGTRSGTNSLRYMDSLEAIHSYRCKIY